MSRVDSFVRARAIPVLGLVSLGFSGAGMAAEGSWWQRLDGYATAGVAKVDAEPFSGHTITAAFDDSRTAATDKRIAPISGRETKHYLPVFALGARLPLRTDLTVGLEGQYYDFADAISTAPRNHPDVPTPLPNFATYVEDSQFKLRAIDLGATVGYSRWGGTAELLAGYRDAKFRTRATFHTFGVFTTGNFINLVLSNGSAWEGGGPVAGLRLNYQIPAFPLRVVARYSYSHLDGESDGFARSAGTVTSSPSAPLVGAATVTRNNADAKMKIHDQEYGLQYDFNRGLTFVRASWMQTKWTIDGPELGGAGFGGTIGDLTTNAYAAGGQGSGKLSGALLTVGFSF